MVQPNWLEQTTLPEHQGEKNELVIIVSGWFTHDKGILDLIHILPELDRKSNRPYRVEIYGRGPAEEELRAMIRTHGLEERCSLHDWVGRGELNRKMRAADILLFLSYFEGMPNTILEAMRAGIAVVSTNVGAIPEFIPDENLAYLSHPGDAAAKVEALATLINEPDRLSRARALNREMARSIPDPHAVARALKQTIESI